MIAETWKFNKHLESKLLLMEMNCLFSGRWLRLEKIRNNVLRENTDIKYSVLDYIKYKHLNVWSSVKNEERLPRKFWNGVRLEKEEQGEGKLRNSLMQEVTTEIWEIGINSMELVDKEKMDKK
jgi:hypothetical protein